MSETKEERKEVRDAFNHAIEEAQKVDNIQGFIILVAGGVEVKEEGKSPCFKGVNACGGPLAVQANLYKNISPKIVEAVEVFDLMSKMMKGFSEKDEKEQNNRD